MGLYLNTAPSADQVFILLMFCHIVLKHLAVTINLSFFTIFGSFKGSSSFWAGLNNNSAMKVFQYVMFYPSTLEVNITYFTTKISQMILFL